MGENYQWGIHAHGVPLLLVFMVAWSQNGPSEIPSKNSSCQEQYLESKSCLGFMATWPNLTQLTINNL